MMAFLSDIRGNIAIVSGLLMPVIVIGMGMSVDYTAWTAQARKLQAIADISALTAAREMYLANTDAAQIKTVANNVAQAQLTVGGKSGQSPITVTAQIIHSGEAVEVVVSQNRNSYFADAVIDKLAPLSATAVARAMGGGRICVLTLDPAVKGALTMDSSSRLTANNCGVYSNSGHSEGLEIRSAATVTAELICSVGGYDANKSSTDPVPLSDCPPVEDPLSQRAAPAFSGCDEINLRLKNENRTLSPGVYCGGLEISGSSEVTFLPGVYVIKDGPLDVVDEAEISGENVGFYLTGSKATFMFKTKTTVSLTAPKDGDLAGLLFFEDRNAPPLGKHQIESDNARMLLGTIYLPRGQLTVDAKKPVANESAYTAIVVNRMELDADPNLVLNTNYNQTDIPVPTGIGNTGRNIVLER